VPVRGVLAAGALLGGCWNDDQPAKANGVMAEEVRARPQISYPREWSAVDRATPDLEGRYGPHDWGLCRGIKPCAATTYAPVDLDEPRPSLTVLVTAKKVWRTTPDTIRWRAQWRWVDPLLGACLGDALDLDLDSPTVSRRLIEHEDGFWWTFALEGTGPCDIRGGIELAAQQDTGRATRLTAGGHVWGTPAAVGFATDVLHQTYGGPIGPK